MKNTGLGRGLEALLGDAALQAENSAVTLRLSEIEPNAEQPRKAFDESALEELAESIRQHGVITPLLVRRIPSGAYQIIAGERRWRAARLAGLHSLPAVIYDIDDRKAAEWALVENLQREDLNPLEVAEGYHTLMNEYALTQEDVAGRVGRSRPAVANTLRLLLLPASVQTLVREGKLSEGHGRAILGLSGTKRQESAAKRILERQLNVRQAEALVRSLAKTPAEKESAAARVSYVEEYETALSRGWGRKVHIVAGRRKGRLELEFYDAKDLERLVDALMMVAESKQMGMESE